MLLGEMSLGETSLGEMSLGERTLYPKNNEPTSNLNCCCGCRGRRPPRAASVRRRPRLRWR
jgi:hypothetical protein